MPCRWSDSYCHPLYTLNTMRSKRRDSTFTPAKEPLASREYGLKNFRPWSIRRGSIAEILAGNSNWHRSSKLEERRFRIPPPRASET
ncbi:uncharacterized protein RCC_05267 [Ramularia collo-cygni]|uniref:Uncharacterized protein n=1 Tax=Ramularia collo-cygni TaxID=112498 RepID=A0A2D3V776_9PEZI|nr:uncharacterized protein RCC_05267 [Ramularia collo-cygni]CZT19416.1 uncharacterized protein RCC_05267 [Ramularia collo-cygni]